MLYEPTVSEVTYHLDKALHRAPILADRIEKARTMLLSFNEFFCAPSAHQPYWEIASSSRKDVWFQVCTTPSAWSCTCEDFRTRGAVIKGYTICKHILAACAYHEILAEHCSRRVIGPVSSGSCVHRARTESNTWLLRDEKSGQLVDWCNKDYAFSTVWHRDRSLFASDLDVAAFAHWLRQAHPTPTPEQRQQEIHMMRLTDRVLPDEIGSQLARQFEAHAAGQSTLRFEVASLDQAYLVLDALHATDLRNDPVMQLLNLA